MLFYAETYKLTSRHTNIHRAQAPTITNKYHHASFSVCPLFLRLSYYGDDGDNDDSATTATTLLPNHTE
jgi:hypothetical protein